MYIWPVAVIGIAVVIWLLYANRPADVRIPDAPALPSPNAYDIYLEAARLADIGDESIPDPEELSAGQKTEIVGRYDAALRKLREGLTLARTKPPVSPGLADGFADFANLRTLARVLSVEASLNAEQGDAAGAISSTLDSVQLGADLGRDGTLIEYMVGVAVEAIGTNRAFGFVSRLDTAGAREAAKRVSGIIATLPQLDAVVRGEQRFCMTSLKATLSHWNWRWRLVRGCCEGVTGAPYWWYAAGLLVRSLFLTRRGVVRDCQRAWNGILAKASLPYQDAARLWEASSNWLVDFVIPSIAMVIVTNAERKVQLAFLACALALRAWKLERGEYPESLVDLTPEYLDAVPVDPFGYGEAMRYRRSGDGYTLYSVGPDGIDNGGRPLQDRRPEDGLVGYWKAQTHTKSNIVLESADLEGVS